jgi:uncharacterized protein YbjT (DUF2867 family)
VVVAGATGFVGRALCERLKPAYHVIGLTRHDPPPPESANGIVWRKCDLFSLLELEAAMQGADYAVYLVHSMLPSSRLTQGNFADFDLVLADNLARAATHCGVKQIVYLGGLIPDEPDLSPHLASRLEVEKTLGSGATPVTGLRAGIVVGPGGSSLPIVVNLVQRLPFMLLPKWTQSLTQPIALVDVVRAIERVLGDTRYFGRHFDIGGPEVLTYRQLLERTAAVLGRRSRLINAPIFSPRLSKLWVSLFGGAPLSLVGPLVDSLRHSLVVVPNELQSELAKGAMSLDDALRTAVDGTGKLLPHPNAEARSEAGRVRRQAKRVRSVQRLPLPPGWTAREAAQEYYRWLPRFVWPFLRCKVDLRGHCRFHLRGCKRLLLLELSLSPERSQDNRQLFYLTRGFLAQPDNAKARFEMREVLNGRWVIAAIHDYAPTLPWYLYNLSQAQIHLWVMRGFARHLRRLSEAGGQAVMRPV